MSLIFISGIIIGFILSEYKLRYNNLKYKNLLDKKYKIMVDGLSEEYHEMMYTLINEHYITMNELKKKYN